MTTALYIILAVVIVGSALGTIMSRNAVYAALYLALNFMSVALLYLFLGAPFIALVQVTVYAGSIMVLFIFVIMLLGAERLAASENLRGQRFLAIALGVVLLAILGTVFISRAELTGIVTPPTAVDFGSPRQIGTALYTQYWLPVMITSMLLLVATVGAILLTRGEGTSIRDNLKRVDEKEQADQEE
ncbi:MAG: NADH-quinone oxidoreductase subunit J [Anaerolineae bacterium]|jgi:NADH-quinone oxidoreductase subunit J|nr:NADH-quinone oxidoreductase subunit J [Anaerolineae bacterium]